jgi:hypothetical protein
MRIAFLFLLGACAPMSSNSGTFVSNIAVRGTTLQIESCEMQLDLDQDNVIERLTGGGRTPVMSTPNCKPHDSAFSSAVRDGAR